MIFAFLQSSPLALFTNCSFYIYLFINRCSVYVLTVSRADDINVMEHVSGNTFGRWMRNDISVSATSQSSSNFIACGSFVTNYATVLFI